MYVQNGEPRVLTAHSKTYGSTRRMRYKAKVEVEAYDQLLLKLIYKIYVCDY